MVVAEDSELGSKSAFVRLPQLGGLLLLSVGLGAGARPHSVSAFASQRVVLILMLATAG